MQLRPRQLGWLLPAILAFAGVMGGGMHTAILAQEPDAPPMTQAVDPPPVDPAAPMPSEPMQATPKPKPEELLPGELPKLMYLKGEDGKLRAVPGMSYEQFMEIWKHGQNIAQENQQPAFSLTSIDISGNASGNNAELIARFKIVAHQSGWVGVPLGLNAAVMRSAPVYEGPGEQVMHVDPEAQGHVAWIRGEAGQTHQLELKLVTSIEQVGPLSRLKLQVVRAAESRLQLIVPLAQASAQVSEGSLLDAVRPLAGGKTELRAIGLGTDFELTWHPADSKIAGLPTILEATGKQIVRIDGRSVNTEATLTVRSLGSEFDHFQVRLPPGADYIGTPESGISLVAIDAAALGGKLYDVRLDKKTTGPVEVRLVTERARNAAQDDTSLELAGFEVLGAVRQSGTVAVLVDGNWQIIWGESNRVRSVDDVAASVPRDEVTAGFEYFVQPYSLPARVVPQKTRIRVEPQYVLLVSGEEVLLKGTLKYLIRGAKVRSLAVDMPGWEVDAVGPASLVNVDAAITGSEEGLTIPLLQSTSGELELTFEARQRLVPGAEQIRLDLPEPRGDVMAADVAVVSDDPIELLPRLDEIQGMAPQFARPELTLPERQQDPLLFRTTGGAARFVADMTVHAQAISTSINTDIRLGESEARVEELLSYNVAYQPTDHFLLIVPAGLRPERITIMHEGTKLIAEAVRERTPGDQTILPVRVNLPVPVIGACQLQVSYTRVHEKPPTQASALVVVPLVVPGEGTLSDNQLRITSQPGINANYPQGPWSREGRGNELAEASELHLSARRAIGEVTLAISSKSGPVETATNVLRALIETELTDEFRQDRALFRVRTNRERVDITLPEGADVRSLSLLVNGIPVLPDSIKQRTLTIPLAGGGDYLLELRYLFATRAAQGSFVLEGPQIPSARWTQEVYWQVDLPASEHVLLPPRHYTEELQWDWRGFYWTREATIAEQPLEQWVGAGTIADPVDPLTGKGSPHKLSNATNRYLFSTVGRVESLDLYSLSRAKLVLLGSLPLLVLGLLVIYFPAVRHPAGLFVFAVLVACTAFIAPHLAILIGQASLLGILLLGLAAILARLTPHAAVPPATPVRGSSYAVIERSVTELYHRSPASGSNASGQHISDGHPASTSTTPLLPTLPEGPS